MIGDVVINFTQLEYFLAVARNKNFSRAAEDSYVSQSCLSKQIKALEEELGVALFDRSSTGASLTAAGEQFLDFAVKTHCECENIMLALGKYTFSGQDRVRLGAVPLMEAYDLDSTLADFQIDNMGTQVDLVEREQANLVRRLELDQVDLAIMVTNSLSPDEYDWVPLVRDEIVVVCSNRHPLARSRRVAIGDLKDERFVLLDSTSANYSIVTRHCREAGFFPNISFMHTRHRPLLSAVKRDIGITLLARALTHTKDEASLSCVSLKDPFFMEVGLVYRRDRQLTPWANALVKFFASMYATPIGDVSEHDSGQSRGRPAEFPAHLPR